MEQRFAGAVALVTGAASGIGAATACRLASEGAQIVAMDRDAGRLDAVVASLPGTFALCVDLSDSAAVDLAVHEAVNGHGRIDLLAHVAGVAPAVEVKQRAGEFQSLRMRGESNNGFDGAVALSDEEWFSVTGTNLDGTFHIVRAVLRRMIPQRAGAIVTVSSAAALGGRPGFSHYCASKAGMRLFTQAVALEAIGYGIRINAVAPGATATPMFAATPTSNIAAFGGIPIGRAAAPDEVAAVIAFLLSTEASYVVGETVNVNGGLLLV